MVGERLPLARWRFIRSLKSAWNRRMAVTVRPEPVRVTTPQPGTTSGDIVRVFLSAALLGGLYGLWPELLYGTGAGGVTLATLLPSGLPEAPSPRVIRHDHNRPLLTYEERRRLFAQMQGLQHVVEVLAARPEGKPISYTFQSARGRITSNRFQVFIPGSGVLKDQELVEGDIVAPPDSALRFTVESIDRGRRTVILRQLNIVRETLPKRGDLLRGGSNDSILVEREQIRRVVESLRDSNYQSVGHPVLDQIFRLAPLTPSGPVDETPLDLFDKRLANDPSQFLSAQLFQNNTELLLIQGPAGSAKTTLELEMGRQTAKKGDLGYVVSYHNLGVDKAISGLRAHPQVPALRLSNDPTKLGSGTLAVWPGNRPRDDDDEGSRNGSFIPSGIRHEVIDRFMKERDAWDGGAVFGATNISVETDFASQQSELASLRAQGADMAVMDESSLSTIPAALGLIRQLKAGGKLTLIGDIKQLTVRRLNREELVDLRRVGVPDETIQLYQTSIFEWLLNQGIGDRVELDTNYRNPELIVQMLSEIFYDGRIRAFHQEPPTPDTFRMIDLNNSNGKRKRYDTPVGTSFINKKSAKIDLALVEHYHKNLGIPLNEITIVTPYLAQVELLGRQLRRKYGDHADLPRVVAGETDGQLPSITTIDGYQGGENRYVIVDMVSSNPQGIIGFNAETRRFLVAVSRSTEGLAVVWDSITFTEDRLGDRAELLEARALYRRFKTWHEKNVLPLFPDQKGVLKTHTPSAEDEETAETPEEAPVMEWQIKLPGWNGWRVQIFRNVANAFSKQRVDPNRLRALIEQVPRMIHRLDSDRTELQIVSDEKLLLYFTASPASPLITLVTVYKVDEVMDAGRRANMKPHEVERQTVAQLQSPERLGATQHALSLTRQPQKHLLTKLVDVKNFFEQMDMAPIQADEGSVVRILLEEKNVFGLFESFLFHPLEGLSLLTQATQVLTHNSAARLVGYSNWRFDLVCKELIAGFQRSRMDTAGFIEGLEAGSELTRPQKLVVDEFARAWHQRWGRVEHRLLGLIEQAFSPSAVPDTTTLRDFYYSAAVMGEIVLTTDIQRRFEIWMGRYLRTFAEDDVDVRELAHDEVKGAHKALQESPSSYTGKPFTVPELNYRLETIELAIQRRKEAERKRLEEQEYRERRLEEEQRRKRLEEEQRMKNEKQKALSGDSSAQTALPALPPPWVSDSRLEWVPKEMRYILKTAGVPEGVVSDAHLVALYLELNRPHLDRPDQTRRIRQLSGLPEEIRERADVLAAPLGAMAYPMLLMKRLDREHSKITRVFGKRAPPHKPSTGHQRLVSDPILHEFATRLCEVGLGAYMHLGMSYERVLMNREDLFLPIRTVPILLKAASEQDFWERLHIFLADLPESGDEQLVSRLRETLLEKLNPTFYHERVDELWLIGYLSQEEVDAARRVIAAIPAPAASMDSDALLAGYNLFAMLALTGEHLWDLMKIQAQKSSEEAEHIRDFRRTWIDVHHQIHNRPMLRSLLRLQHPIDEDFTEVLARDSFVEKFAQYVLEKTERTDWPALHAYMDPLTTMERRTFDVMLPFISQNILIWLVHPTADPVLSPHAPVKASIQEALWLPGSWPDQMLKVSRMLASSHFNPMKPARLESGVAPDAKTLFTPLINDGEGWNLFAYHPAILQRTILEVLGKIPTGLPTVIVVPHGEALLEIPAEAVTSNRFARTRILTQDTDSVRRILAQPRSPWQAQNPPEIIVADLSRLLFTNSFIANLLDAVRHAADFKTAVARIRDVQLSEVENPSASLAKMNVHESLQERAGLIIALQLIPHVIDALNGVLMLRLAQKFGRPEPTGKELPPWVPPLMDKKARLHAFNSAIGSRLFKILLWLKHSEGHVFMDIESPEEGPDPFRPRPAVLMGSKPPSSQGSVRVELSGLILALGSFFLLSPGSIQMAISLTSALILARVMRRTEHRFSVRPLAAA